MREFSDNLENKMFSKAITFISIPLLFLINSMFLKPLIEIHLVFCVKDLTNFDTKKNKNVFCCAA